MCLTCEKVGKSSNKSQKRGKILIFQHQEGYVNPVQHLRASSCNSDFWYIAVTHVTQQGRQKVVM